MHTQETIIPAPLAKYEYTEIVEKAVNYALLSLPFTVNRMDISKLGNRILNIAKGKIAEGLFEHYCRQNNIPADFASCKTPFWKPDKRDFILDGAEWDLKNNFIYHSGSFYSDYTQLPALVPDKHSADQWAARRNAKNQPERSVKFLFTFMKGAGLNNGKRGKSFLEIKLSNKQLRLLERAFEKYRGKDQSSKPFETETFWKKMEQLGDTLFYELHFMPPLIITGYAGAEEWSHFKPTGPKSPYNFRLDENKGRRYDKVGKNATLKWFGGSLWTTINNQTVPVGKLPAFRKLIG